MDSLKGILVTEQNLATWFATRLTDLDVRDDTRAYVTSVLAGICPDRDMSRSSLTLAYFDALQLSSFATYQLLGDWVLWSEAFAPEALTERELVLSIGQLSYAACWRMTRGTWLLYDELSDRLPEIAGTVGQLVRATQTR